MARARGRPGCGRRRHPVPRARHRREHRASSASRSALLLQPLPYATPDRLVILWNPSPGLGIAEDWFSTAQYFDIKAAHRRFDEVAIAIGGNYNLTGDGEPERIGTIRVSSNLLPLLGARPALGRLFDRRTTIAPARAGTAVLSHGTWMRRYGGDPRVVGRSLIAQRPAVPDRRRAAGRLHAAARGDAHARRRRGRPRCCCRCRSAPTRATTRTREDYNILAQAEAGRARCSGAGGDGRPHRAAAPRASRMSIRRMAASPSASCRCTSRWSATCGGRCSSCSAPSASCC